MTKVNTQMWTHVRVRKTTMAKIKEVTLKDEYGKNQTQDAVIVKALKLYKKSLQNAGYLD